MSSNEDAEYYLTSNYKFNSAAAHQNSNINMGSSSPPRPGFPQRIMALDQHAIRSKSPMSKSYSFEDQKSNFTASPSVNPSENIRNIVEENTEMNSASNFLIDDDNNKCSENNYEGLIDTLNLQATSPTSALPATSTFDYLYEFSETRKVLEEFFKCPTDELASKLEKFSDFNESDVESLVNISLKNVILNIYSIISSFRIYSTIIVHKSIKKMKYCMVNQI